jgi:uncharacterized protein
MFEAFVAAGFAAIRFDFRGVGNSQGEHGGGIDERLDMAAAIETIAPYAIDGPVIAAGYSFGSMVALNVTDARLAGWIAIAPPLAAASAMPVAASDHRPKLIASGTHDQFTTFQAASEATAGWLNRTIVEIEMADHFLHGRSQKVAEAAVAFALELTA